MQITFLAAHEGIPLSKQFGPTPADTQAYPNVARFDSYEHDVDSLEEFFEALRLHAEMGHALLKGHLDRPLRGDRRAGATNPLNPTHYLILDCDFDSGFADSHDLLTHMGLGNVSHIIHHSASAGVHSRPGLRAHLIFLLESGVSPPMVKLWAKERNLSTPGLANQISLNATGLSLKWPLDITVNQNDKLIYIADPICEGIEDAMAGKRFELVHKAKPKALISMSPDLASSLVERESRKIDELRQMAGLPRKAATYTTGQSNGAAFEYLKNPDRATVTGVRHGRGFTYVNLNGGDSWGQYFPDNNPEYLYSFKGDPVVRLRDIDPDFYHNIRKAREVEEDSLHSIIFRWPVADTTHAAEVSSTGVTVLPLSRPSIRDYCVQRGMTVPDSLPEYEMEFAPKRAELFDLKSKWLNLFKPTEYLLASYPSPRPCPPIIRRVLRSITVDDECYTHLCNWIAYVFQTREHTQTAWIFRGAQGTGKGLLMNRILSPVFGHDHCVETTLPIFSERYNGYLEKCMFLMLDEGDLGEKDADAMMSKVKNLITEPTHDIRRMRTDVVKVPNYTNLIVACNKLAPIVIEETDRRWNVAPSQDTPLKISHEEVDNIADELHDFSAFLAHYAVDARAALNPLANRAKQDLFAATENSVDRIFRALKTGDLDYFVENLIDAPSTSLMDAKFSAYDALVKRLAAEYRHGPVTVSVGDARTLYEYLSGASTSPAKFGRMATIRWERSRTLRQGDQILRGWRVEFDSKEPAMVAAILKTSKLRVIK